MPRLIPPVLPRGTFSDRPQSSLTTGDGLLLRPWQPGDESALVAAYDDPAIRYWHHRTMTPDEAVAWIAATAEQWSGETDAEWAVTDGAEVVGRVALRDVDLSVGQCEISYWTCPQVRGRGVASQAVDRIASWALQTVGFWRLEIRHSVNNLASCQVAQHAGFTQEAALASQHIHEDGWHDIHIHSRWRQQPSS
ncbi:MAG: N-acetyltransferase [Nitriliruptor sp.]|nr:MAG: N-acetyltransferase [Nitriliruptor sp.]